MLMKEDNLVGSANIAFQSLMYYSAQVLQKSSVTFSITEVLSFDPLCTVLKVIFTN